MSEKPLIIKGPLPTLEDVFHIARKEATKIFKVNPERIKVKPFVQPYGVGSYLVVVEFDGCSSAPEVVGGRKEKH